MVRTAQPDSDALGLLGCSASGAANKKMMEDPDMNSMEMPFDGKRMIFGGFEVMFDASKTKD